MKRVEINWTNHFIELLIVIIGISIAFWLNNISIRSKEDRQEISYLTDIRNDLRKDSLKLISNIRFNEEKSEKLEHAFELISGMAPIDSVLVNVIEIGNYEFFNPDNFTLTSLLQSGDLKLIESEPIKRETLRLLKIYESIDNMQKNFLQALDDNYFPMLLTKVDMVGFKALDIDFFYSVEIKNYCAFTLNETTQHIQTYKHAQNQIEKLRQLIEIELN